MAQHETLSSQRLTEHVQTQGKWKPENDCYIGRLSWRHCDISPSARGTTDKGRVFDPYKPADFRVRIKDVVMEHKQWPLLVFWGKVCKEEAGDGICLTWLCQLGPVYEFPEKRQTVYECCIAVAPLVSLSQNVCFTDDHKRPWDVLASLSHM